MRYALWCLNLRFTPLNLLRLRLKSFNRGRHNRCYAIFHAHFFFSSLKNTKGEKEMFKISFTGHRPQKLPVARYQSHVRQFLSAQLSLHPDLLVISGGALGVDQVAAEASLDLGIPFVFILPFPVDVMAARWPSSARKHLTFLISRAVHTYTVQRSFSMSGYQRRNEVMVDHCDLLCAVFDGSPGGTANCIRYAQDVSTEIHFIPL